MSEIPTYEEVNGLPTQIEDYQQQEAGNGEPNGVPSNGNIDHIPSEIPEPLTTETLLEECEQNNGTQVTEDSEKSQNNGKKREKKGLAKIQEDIENNEQKQEETARSIHVNNVEYSTKEEQLIEHFESVGEIARAKIPKNQATGKGKGYAYIEFKNEDSVEQAIIKFNESLFKGRQLKVTKKRLNVPGKKIKKAIPKKKFNQHKKIHKPRYATPMMPPMMPPAFPNLMNPGFVRTSPFLGMPTVSAPFPAYPMQGGTMRRPAKKRSFGKNAKKGAKKVKILMRVVHYIIYNFAEWIP